MDKVQSIAYSREANVYRWHQYELNLLGDPEMPVWTDIPRVLTVTLPHSVPNVPAPAMAIMRDSGGNRTEAARKLGISRRTLHRKLHTYGLQDL